RPERAARLSGVRDARGTARGGAAARHRSAGGLPKDELATMIVAADLQALPGNNDHAVHAVDVERHDIELAIQRRRAERHPFFLTGEELNRVFHWKLRGLHERTAAQRGRNTEAAYRLISQAVFEIVGPHLEYESVVRLGLLTALTGVGVPL